MKWFPDSQPWHSFCTCKPQNQSNVSSIILVSKPLKIKSKLFLLAVRTHPLLPSRMGETCRMLWQWLTKVPGSDSRDSSTALDAMGQIFMETPDLTTLSLHSRPTSLCWLKASSAAAHGFTQCSLEQCYASVLKPCENSVTAPGAGWSHLVWSWSLRHRLGSRWCCPCTGCPQGTEGCTAEHGSASQPCHSRTTRTTRTSCLQQAQRDTHTDTVIKELKCTEWERNSLHFWARTESLLPII